jgi:uncharacterized membrane protein YjgN (DUF898 family)
MAEITDPQVVLFANDRTRSAADKMEILYSILLAWQADYVAQGIAAKIVTAGASNIIADGSEIDGRQRITGNSIINLHAALTQLLTAWDTTLVTGVGATVKAVTDGIQVNGTPR